jgi:D-glycero-D-manno-heptose 1,7-bisphosphate phosphatase
VFLDRDGVLNAPVVRGRRPYPPPSVADVVILPGVVESINAFRDAGLVSVVVTNQPDIARGHSTTGEVDAINAEVGRATGIDLMVVCPHDDADCCACRKPSPGMIVDTAASIGVDLRRSVMVGDRWRDIVAGQAAGVPTVFIDRDYDEPRPSNPSLIVSDLSEATAWILEVTSGGPPA